MKKQVELKSKLSLEKIHLFKTMPVHKALVRLAIPSFIVMFVLGSYSFIDQVLAVNLAGANYNALGSLSSKDVVRLMTTMGGPITALIMSIALLFSVGISTRFSINLGRNNIKAGISAMKSGMTFAMLLAMILIPILFISSKQWITYQFESPGNFPGVDKMISTGYWFTIILVCSTPLQFFNSIISGLLRSEARTKQMTIAMTAPMFLNLFLDYIFMGPLKLGVYGGAAATVISYATTTLLLIIFININRKEKSLIKWKNLFGYKISKWSVFAILVVGISPFLRNIAQSITQTFEFHVLSDVSLKYFGNQFAMRVVLTGVFPVFMLTFPLMFSITQAATPLASFNYGHKNYKRVRETILWAIIYSLILSVVLYAITTIPYLMGYWALGALGLDNTIKNFNDTTALHYALTVIRIMLTMLPVFSLTIAGAILFTSTDRILFSIIANSLRGIILFFPFIYLFQYLSINVVYDYYIFWWFYPVVGLSSSTIVVFMTWWTLRRIHKQTLTLDERIIKLRTWFNRKRKKPKSSTKSN